MIRTKSIRENLERTGATVPIFARPEYVVIEDLLPGIDQRVLSAEEAISRLRCQPTLVPVGVNPFQDDGRIYFADLGEHNYREWQHIYTVERLIVSGAVGDSFSVSAPALLDRPALVDDAIMPRGFILHVSRCGSTLLGKAMARAYGVTVINQPAPLQQGFWAWMTGNWNGRRIGGADDIRRFRNLVSLLCRPRQLRQQEIFIKFISWNSLYADFIHQAFPEVPMLFMYRDPVEVVASVLEETSAALVARHGPLGCFLTGRNAEQTASLDTLEYLAVCYANYFNTIARAKAAPKLLDYANLTPDALGNILDRAFGLHPEAGQLERMKGQFSIYSKDDSNQASFVADSRRKGAVLTPVQQKQLERHCAGPWRNLCVSPRNVP